MCQERKNEEDSPAFKTAWMYQYGAMTTSIEHQIKLGKRNKNQEEKQLYGYFKRQIGKISHEETWT